MCHTIFEQLVQKRSCGVPTDFLDVSTSPTVTSSQNGASSFAAVRWCQLNISLMSVRSLQHGLFGFGWFRIYFGWLPRIPTIYIWRLLSWNLEPPGMSSHERWDKQAIKTLKAFYLTSEVRNGVSCCSFLFWLEQLVFTNGQTERWRLQQQQLKQTVDFSLCSGLQSWTTLCGRI